MSERLLAQLLTVADAIAADATPEAAFRAVDRAVADLLGHNLFTVLMLRDGGREVERAYSSNLEAYPVGGRKPMGATPWGDLVITRKQSFLGPDMAAIRWAFFDHALIASLGLGSAINVSIQRGGEILGILAVLDREGAYTTQADVDIVRAFTPCLIQALMDLRGAD